MSDLIDREEAIDALWKALYEYEDNTEKQFQESEDLDVGDWICHKIFVQNMSDIDRQTILNLPSADAVPVIRCKDCEWHDIVHLKKDGTDDLRYKPTWCSLWRAVMNEEDYCSWAERKAE